MAVFNNVIVSPLSHQFAIKGKNAQNKAVLFVCTPAGYSNGANETTECEEGLKLAVSVGMVLHRQLDSESCLRI